MLAETLGELLEMANMYQLNILLQQIQLFLCNQLDENNIDTLMILIQQYNLPVLAQTIQQFKSIQNFHLDSTNKKRTRNTANTSNKQRKFSTDSDIFAINPVPMARFIKEIGQDYKTDLHFTPAALYEIHKAAEYFISNMFATAFKEAKKNSKNEVGPWELQQVMKTHLFKK